VLVNPVGTARRLQALATLGWACSDIGKELGVTRRMVEEWRVCARPVISIRSQQRIADLYARICDEQPTGRYAVKVRNLADRKGWLPPIAWDDDTIDNPTAAPYACEAVHIDLVAVTEALTGRPVALTAAERVEAVRVGTERGMSVREIAAMLGTTGRTVQRKRVAA
jgi:hypothetical protein